VSRPRAADDFATIRARMEELRRERAAGSKDADPRSGQPSLASAASDAERRRRARIEGWPPPWAPTIFARRPRR
jgi:hypothetical protein